MHKEYTIEYWNNGQYNYDVKVIATGMNDAVKQAPKLLELAGHAGAVERNEWQVLYND